MMASMTSLLSVVVVVLPRVYFHYYALTSLPPAEAAATVEAVDYGDDARDVVVDSHSW
jgi:hypothetical protein